MTVARGNVNAATVVGLDLQHFSMLRPYLYHLTARVNISLIRAAMALKPSNVLYTESGESAFRGTRRRGSRTLKSGCQIRDQDPLHAGNISFSDGWDLPKLISHLDDHVFFWPGWEHGPVLSGQNHFQRYAAERPMILRVATTDLLYENRETAPFFCKFNSGAPRCTKGKGSPRGPLIFLSAREFTFSGSDVKEVTFKTIVKLPASTQVVHYPRGNWQPLTHIRTENL